MTPADPRSDVTGVVLAGGRSTRFGDVDKTVVRVNGTPMIEHVLSTHRRVLAPDPIVAVQSTGQRSRIRDALDRPSGVRFVTDADQFSGPVGGLVGACRAATTEHTFVSAADMPRLDPEAIARLCDALEDGIDAVVPECDGRPEPLHGLYRWEAVVDSSAHLDGSLPLRSVVDELDSVLYVTVEQGSILSRSTRNVNTPEQLP